MRGVRWRRVGGGRAMKLETVRLADLGRIVLGRTPWVFLVEAALRTVLLYLLLLVSMRLMGKRMASSVSRNELAALVSLAAAVGPAMESPDRGILPPMIIAAVIVGVQRLIAIGTFRSQGFEQKTQGDVSTLVRDGELELDALRSVVLSRERLFSRLRGEGIADLGTVERAYLEANGAFTVIQQDRPQAGLCILPSWDEDFRNELRPADGLRACGSCGHVVDLTDDRSCGRCLQERWEPAVRS